MSATGDSSKVLGDEYAPSIPRDVAVVVPDPPSIPRNLSDSENQGEGAPLLAGRDRPSVYDVAMALKQLGDVALESHRLLFTADVVPNRIETVKVKFREYFDLSRRLSGTFRERRATRDVASETYITAEHPGFCHHKILGECQKKDHYKEVTELEALRLSSVQAKLAHAGIARNNEYLAKRYRRIAKNYMEGQVSFLRVHKELSVLDSNRIGWTRDSSEESSDDEVDSELPRSSSQSRKRTYDETLRSPRKDEMEGIDKIIPSPSCQLALPR